MAERGEFKPIDHGTHNGYYAHLRRKQTPCKECSAARNLWVKNKSKAKPRDIPQCGTEQGYSRHLRLKEPTCAACKNAHAIKGRISRGSVSDKPIKRRRVFSHDTVRVPLEIFAELYWTASQRAIDMLDEQLGMDTIDRIIKEHDNRDNDSGV